jgi:hypothetical protein
MPVPVERRTTPIRERPQYLGFAEPVPKTPSQIGGSQPCRRSQTTRLHWPLLRLQFCQCHLQVTQADRLDEMTIAAGRS